MHGFALVAAAGNVEQIFAEFRQLAGAEQRAVVHNIRRIAFGITVLGGVGVQHKLRQCAVQAGDLAFHHGETRAGKVGAGFKV